jgi:hypothetical protein
VRGWDKAFACAVCISRSDVTDVLSAFTSPLSYQSTVLRLPLPSFRVSRNTRFPDPYFSRPRIPCLATHARHPHPSIPIMAIHVLIGPRYCRYRRPPARAPLHADEAASKRLADATRILERARTRHRSKYW